MAHQCHVMQCTWQWCRARTASKMNRICSFKSCCVVPSWGPGKWKAAFVSTDSFYLVVIGAVRSSECVIKGIQLGWWTEDGEGLTRLEHHWLFPCSLAAPALWNTFSRNPAFQTPSDRHCRWDWGPQHMAAPLLWQSTNTYLVLCPVVPTFVPPERWQSRELVPCVQTPTLPTATLNLAVW